ncbi:MAG: DUF2306 domain-containing protein [Trueperaceae bacterium]
MTLFGWLHVAAAAAALVTGAAVFGFRKGTKRHVLLGRAYGLALLLVNLPALLLYEASGSFGAFHLLAVVSLATLTAGLAPLLLGYRTRPYRVRHGFFMAWSYVGLVAAGLAQLANAVFRDQGGVAVLVATVSVVSVGGAIVHALGPRIVRASGPGVGSELPRVNR